jgi:cytidylate kinase
MKTKTRSIHQLVDEQIRRWDWFKKERPKEVKLPIITVSREPGSGGQVLAEKVAKILDLDIFHQNIVHQMAENSQISNRLLETLDEKGITIVEEWLTGFSENFWPDHYLKQLIRVIGTLERHGRAVIVGRGANFILSKERVFRLRVVAPLEVRVKNVAREYKVSVDEAKRRIINTDSHRRAFIRKYFHTDVSDARNYDMTLNTENIFLDQGVQIVVCALEQRTGISLTSERKTS